MLELTFVLGGVEMAARFRDQAGIVNLPQFVASDPNAISRADVSGPLFTVNEAFSAKNAATLSGF